MRPDAPSRREFPKRAIAAAALVCAALSVGLLVARSWTIDYPYSIDFQAYWLAGSRVSAGDAEHLYAPGGGPEHGTPQEMAAYEFKNLPIVALGFAPLARLPYLEAKRAFWWIGFASILATGVVLGVSVLPSWLGGPVARAGLGIGFVGMFAPAATALRHGQTTPLVALAVTLAVAAKLAGRSALSGALIAAASVVKLPVLALAGLDAVRGRRRAVLAFGAVLASVVALSFALFGTALQGQYLEGLAFHAGTVMPGHNNQSLAALAARLFGPAPVYDWTPRPMGAGAGIVAFAMTALLVAVVGSALWIARRDARGTSHLMLEVPAALGLGIVALPVAWDHYFLILAPAIAMLAMGLDARGVLARPLVAGTLAVAVVLLAAPTPQWLLDHVDGLGWPARLALSHYLAGALLVIGLAVRGLYAARDTADASQPFALTASLEAPRILEAHPPTGSHHS